MTHIMSQGFHAGDSFEYMTLFMGFDWLNLNGILRSDSCKLPDGFHAMTHDEL